MTDITIIVVAGEPADDLDAIIRIGTRAADCRITENLQQFEKLMDVTGTAVEEAIRHLIEQGLLVVPDDVGARLARPIPFGRS